MDVDGLRERNRHKAQEEADRGPVRADPGAVPIGEAIEAFRSDVGMDKGIDNRHQSWGWS